MKSSLSFKGIDQLVKHLDKAASLKGVQQVVKSNTSNMTANMQKLVPVDTGYMKRSIKMELTEGGFSGQAGPHTDYSAYVEYGTRFQSAQPFVKPAYNEQKGLFIKDLERLLK
ncbi:MULTISPECIES: HK97-gp10 family putative phage morphogenesis protein [Lactococcus]|jgi:HK97 gp10 family phage protein|uniref:HK97-gp10 family putative phage morphogenesis protein n=1 Tax=Lactococcus TaxID=1357 RepID=UPI000C7A8D6F|nr:MULTISPECIES: HK97-gp10 family putative phage morphogenesis protein [Lactococcus]MCT0038683.1 HK97 gp10 family phage protein [Lactococcus lactis subsp. lactis]MCT0504295.1 HK97 gp10 family phage protein [Lactococcus cremoris]MCT0506684.1 HK97 gp10 family phage protein [Lactococcus cremoris]MCT4406533.1 HK97 gp10 family phage protein [Lactococcus cremoris]